MALLQEHRFTANRVVGIVLWCRKFSALVDDSANTRSASDRPNLLHNRRYIMPVAQLPAPRILDAPRRCAVCPIALFCRGPRGPSPPPQQAGAPAGLPCGWGRVAPTSVYAPHRRDSSGHRKHATQEKIDSFVFLRHNFPELHDMQFS